MNIPAVICFSLVGAFAVGIFLHSWFSTEEEPAETLAPVTQQFTTSPLQADGPSTVVAAVLTASPVAVVAGGMMGGAVAAAVASAVFEDSGWND